MAAKIQGRPIMRANQPVPNFVPVPQWVDVLALTANTAAAYTVPANLSLLRLTPTVVPTYGSVTTTAVIPTVNVTNGGASFVIGGQTYLGVNPGEAVSMICASNCIVTIEAWT